MLWWPVPGSAQTARVVEPSHEASTHARDFYALGFKVVWQPFLADKLHVEFGKARGIAEKLGVLLDEGKFLEQQRAAEIRRETSGW